MIATRASHFLLRLVILTGKCAEFADCLRRFIADVTSSNIILTAIMKMLGIGWYILPCFMWRIVMPVQVSPICHGAIPVIGVTPRQGNKNVDKGTVDKV